MSAAAKAPQIEHAALEFHRKPLSIDDLLAAVVRLIGAA
jgi:hypothetical protein